MADITGETNLGGILVTSVDLGLTVPKVVGDGATVTSNVINNPGIAADVVLLAQCNATGSVTVTVDTCASGSTPTFASANKAQVVLSLGASALATSMFALPVQTDVTNSSWAVRIVNNSGASVTFTTLCALDVVSWNRSKQDWHSAKSLFNIVLGKQNPLNVSGNIAAGSGDGRFSLQQ